MCGSDCGVVGYHCIGVYLFHLWDKLGADIVVDHQSKEIGGNGRETR